MLVFRHFSQVGILWLRPRIRSCRIRLCNSRYDLFSFWSLAKAKKAFRSNVKNVGTFQESPNIFILAYILLNVKEVLCIFDIFCEFTKKLLWYSYNSSIETLKILCYNTSELKRRIVQWKTKVRFCNEDKGFKNTAV